MQRTALALALSLAALPAGAQILPPPGGRMEQPPQRRPETPPKQEPPGARPADPQASPPPRGAIMEEVAGTVGDIDRKAHQLTIVTAGGPVTLTLDRNTMVYGPSGLGTVLDLVPGGEVRAGRNADFLAYWIQLRPKAGAKGAPQPAPGQGEGPAGGAGAGATETGAGAPPVGTAPPSVVPGRTPGP